jgi:hypothetical protein
MSPRDSRPRSTARTFAAYVAAWAAVGSIVALVLLRVGGNEDEPLPPVRQPELARAIRAGGCRLAVPARQAIADGGGLPAPGAAAPSEPGVYERPPPASALSAAVRRGTVVVRYRPGLDDEHVDQLESMQEGVPRGTILTPGAAQMRADVTVEAYFRALTCPRLTDVSLDALRLFRGRFLGSRPHP